MGSVSGAGLYEPNSTATLTATANSGYAFLEWDDENTDNPRTITATQDKTYTAIFGPVYGFHTYIGEDEVDEGTIGILSVDEEEGKTLVRLLTTDHPEFLGDYIVHATPDDYDPDTKYTLYTSEDVATEFTVMVHTLN